MKYYILISSIFLFGILISPVKAVGNQSPLVINEFMANPDGSDTAFEWIELKNTSSGSINLSNWQLDGGNLPSYNINSQSFVIVARSKIDLLKRYKNLANIIEHSFSLLNSMDTITLSSSKFMDIVKYSNPVVAKSYERNCTDSTFVLNTKGNSINSINNACLDLGLSIYRDGSWTDNLSGFMNDKVKIKINTKFDRYNWTINKSTSTGSTVDVDLNSLNNIDIRLNTDLNGSPITVTGAITVYGHVYFNEIFANPKGLDSGNEWIEFSNKSHSGIDNWILKDINNQENLSLDNSNLPVYYPSSITINNSNEVLTLLTPSGLIADSITVPTIKDDQSFVLRSGNIWETSLYATPGTTNIDPVVIPVEVIKDVKKRSKEKDGSTTKVVSLKKKIIVKYPHLSLEIHYIDKSNGQEIDLNTKVSTSYDYIIGNFLLILSGSTGLVSRFFV